MNKNKPVHADCLVPYNLGYGSFCLKNCIVIRIAASFPKFQGAEFKREVRYKIEGISITESQFLEPINAMIINNL
jgi:hypothetical protein